MHYFKYIQIFKTIIKLIFILNTIVYNYEIIIVNLYRISNAYSLCHFKFQHRQTSIVHVLLDVTTWLK